MGKDISGIGLTRREAMAAGLGMAGALVLGGAAKAPAILADGDGSMNTHPLRTASIIVAASNAPDRWKEAADYVCDGVTDCDTLNNALDNLSLMGGVVMLSEGTFYIHKTIKLPNHGSTLKGCGCAVSGRDNPPLGGTELRYMPTDSSPAVELGVAGAERRMIGLQDLTITCRRNAGHSGDGVRVHRITWTPEMLKNVGVHSAGRDGIHVEQCWSSNIVSCYTRNSGRYGQFIKQMNAGHLTMSHSSHNAEANVVCVGNTGLNIVGGSLSAAPVGILFGIAGSNYGVSVTGVHFEVHGRYDIYTPNKAANGAAGQVRLWNTTVSNCFFNSRQAWCAVLLNGSVNHLELRNNYYHITDTPQIRAAQGGGRTTALIQETLGDRSPVVDIPIDIETVDNNPLHDTQAQHNDYWWGRTYTVTFMDVTKGQMFAKGAAE